MSQPISFPWGGATLDLALPASWTVLGELKPREEPAPDDVAEACARALASPIGAPRLSERNLFDKRVLIVSDDHSRPTPVAAFIGPVLAELGLAGVRDENIEILLATGVHRESREAEVAHKLGAQVMRRFRWSCHDAYDDAALHDFGTTSRGTPVKLSHKLAEADLVVLLGAVEPHLLLGFGGGLKMIIPGCAGAETIGTNHMQGVSPDHFDFVGEDAADSPMRLDLEEGARLAGDRYFIVNTTLDREGQPTRFFCGHPIEAHRAAQAFVQDLAGVTVPEPADVALSNSFPADGDLRQSIKCVGNSLYACKPGGLLLGAVYCKEGLGEIPIPRKTLPYPLLRLLVRTMSKHKILRLVKKAKRGEPIEEIFVGHFALQMLRRNHVALLSHGLNETTGKKLGPVRVFNNPQQWLAWARKKVPKRATVWVFPHGGVSYARPA